MWKSKDVYYISGNTGILAKDMGKALLCQFPEISFNEELIPFIRSESQARRALEKILSQSPGRYPLVFSTLLSTKLNQIFDTPEVEFLNICDHFLVKLEELLEARAIREPGTSRHLDDNTMTRRVNAIHYSIAHDDGTGTKDYDEADLIVVGVSRSGKTPVSVFLATQMGLKTANYPLVQDDLTSIRLPPEIIRNKKRVVGLSTTPQMLHSFREKRYPGSTYANLATCEQELKQSDQIFLKYQIPVVFSDGRSIEETATQVAQELDLKRQPGF
ncbi:MAG: pyruvate, phosphate dikinase/phosphoenolpyruvate synthase regulator [Desulfobulbaceae bacterium]|nr:MAG: pyruvate, phosphate dikinase/phosphoenolpyruvate synthase regulator [Desulfobulbaceae bacterium]